MNFNYSAHNKISVEPLEDGFYIASLKDEKDYYAYGETELEAIDRLEEKLSFCDQSLFVYEDLDNW